MPITKQLVVNVITVCNNAGTDCASHGPSGNPFYEAETDKIWAQAGIDIKFVDFGILSNTALLSGANSVADFTGPLAGPGTTMYLVKDIVCASCTLLGQAWVDAGGLLINMGAVNAYNAGIGQLDAIAHELGHNLGINHIDTDLDFLMHSPTDRHIPDSLADICPDGACYDLLTSDQIAFARRSTLLIDFVPSSVPEPGSLALVAVALLAGGVARRRV